VGFLGKSDPYVKISGVGVTLKTKVINNNLNPVWNETFNIMIDELNQNPQLLVRMQHLNSEGLYFRKDKFFFYSRLNASIRMTPSMMTFLERNEFIQYLLAIKKFYLNVLFLF